MIELTKIIALKKDGSIIMFDDRAEFEECDLKDYKRIWADGRAVMISLYDSEDKAERLKAKVRDLKKFIRGSARKKFKF